jgi:hypothetical protein
MRGPDFEAKTLVDSCGGVSDGGNRGGTVVGLGIMLPLHNVKLVLQLKVCNDLNSFVTTITR